MSHFVDHGALLSRLGPEPFIRCGKVDESSFPSFKMHVRGAFAMVSGHLQNTCRVNLGKMAVIWKPMGWESAFDTGHQTTKLVSAWHEWMRNDTPRRLWRIRSLEAHPPGSADWDVSPLLILNPLARLGRLLPSPHSSGKLKGIAHLVDAVLQSAGRQLVVGVERISTILLGSEVELPNFRSHSHEARPQRVCSWVAAVFRFHGRRSWLSPRREPNQRAGYAMGKESCRCWCSPAAETIKSSFRNSASPSRFSVLLAIAFGLGSKRRDVLVLRDEVVSGCNSPRSSAPTKDSNTESAHSLRNRLQKATLGLHLIQKMLECNKTQDVESILFKVFNELKLIEDTIPSKSSESRPTVESKLRAVATCTPRR